MKEPHFGEEIPLRWLQFESEVARLAAEDHYPYRTLQEVLFAAAKSSYDAFSFHVNCKVDGDRRGFKEVEERKETRFDRY